MTISTELRQEAWATSSDLPLVLLTIDHDSIDPPIRVVNNTEDIESNGEEFIAYPFSIVLPDSQEAAPPRARLQISNVSREIMQAVRTISSPAQVTIQVIRQDDHDTVEMFYDGMLLVGVRGGAITVEGNLEFEDLMREPYPAVTFSPAEFPGLVR